PKVASNAASLLTRARAARDCLVEKDRQLGTRAMSEYLFTAAAGQLATLPTSPASGKWSLFFFQAEDGIRDYKVTGVQTCALPIYGVARFERSYDAFGNLADQTFFDERDVAVVGPNGCGRIVQEFNRFNSNIDEKCQIGRASCRERVKMSGGAVPVEEK